jgi:hypothetical protein
MIFHEGFRHSRPMELCLLKNAFKGKITDIFDEFLVPSLNAIYVPVFPIMKTVSSETSAYKRVTYKLIEFFK